MAFIKMTNIMTPKPSIRKNEQWIYCLKTAESANTWQILRPHPTLLLYGRHNCMAPNTNCWLLP